jgi:hypothetical protein
MTETSPPGRTHPACPFGRIARPHAYELSNNSGSLSGASANWDDEVDLYTRF